MLSDSAATGAGPKAGPTTVVATRCRLALLQEQELAALAEVAVGDPGRGVEVVLVLDAVGLDVEAPDSAS